MADLIPEWREYEREVRDELVSRYGEAAVRYDVKVRGVVSETRRQIDVVVDESDLTDRSQIAVDAKFRNRRIDVKDVEAFMGMLNDVRVGRGLMITNLGYSDAALARAHRDDVDLDLDVLTLDEFREWQASGGIPFAGRNGIVLPAPIGWVLDATGQRDPLARLYRRGLTFAQAYDLGEFMYVNIWDRRPPVETLEQLLEKQRIDILRKFPDAVITVSDFVARRNGRTCLRRTEIATYPSAEITAFAEFETGILFVVLFTPLAVERRNVRKLEYVIAKCVPAHIEHGS